jgi:hypothetical protein
MLTIRHEAQPFGVCGICGGLFKPVKSNKAPAVTQLNEQYDMHFRTGQCNEENRGKVIPPHGATGEK